MKVGTVREQKDGEYRVGLTPEGVFAPRTHGHDVLVEQGAPDREKRTNADWFDRIDDERRAFIERQHMFFIATAPTDVDDGFVNLPPKGRTLLRVLGPNLVGYLDYPGSGNETAKHTAENGRVTLMLCSFDPAARILRLFGKGRRVDLDDPELREHRAAFADDLHPYVRQAFFSDVEKVQTSCGYAVPRMDFVADRETLDKHCERTLEPREFADGMPVAGKLVSRKG